MRFDHKKIVQVIRPGSKVLDLGCGDGSLIQALKINNVKCVGIEIDENLIDIALNNKVSVIQQDLDEGLKNYKTNSFDYVIINETIQVVKNTLGVLEEALRVGRVVIVGFPNFARWKIRFSFAISGLLPKNPSLPYEWHNTPNVRIVTVKDFKKTCNENNINIVKEIHYIKQKEKSVRFFPNYFATNSIFVLKK